MKTKYDLIQEWLLKADHDLGMAKLALDHKPDYTDSICFHCQQAAEKSLKAYLVFLYIRFPKTHDLMYLLDIIIEKTPQFESLLNAIEKVDEYTVEIRYPGGFENPSVDAATDAYSASNKVYLFVVDHIQNLS